MKKVLTVKEVAELLGICNKTAYNLVRQALATGRTFKVIKVCGHYRIPTQPFLNWLDRWEGNKDYEC